MKRCLLGVCILCGAVWSCGQSTEGVAWRDRRPLTGERLRDLEAIVEKGAVAADAPEAVPSAREVWPVPSFDDVSLETGVYDLVAAWGLSWTDIENDGDPDLFVSNHMHYPSALYVNEGGLLLRRSRMSLERDVGLDDHVGVWGDYDGDFDLDLYTANGFYRDDHLMRNDDGKSFPDVTESAGVMGGSSGRGRSALWSDVDGDGWLDLLVFNLLSPDLCYRSNGDGTFSETAREAGLQNSFLKDGAVVGDLDGDGDQDLYLPLIRGRQRNLLFLNRGDGVFVEMSDGSGADLDGASRACAMGDYDNDGDLDLYVVRDAPPGDALLRNRGDATFEDVTTQSGIVVVERGVRNAGFADFDNDGDLDLYITNGGPHDDNNPPNVLLVNRGDGTFEDRTAASDTTGPERGSSASAAFADFNGDGFLDIAMTNGGGGVEISGPTQLLRNRGSAEPGSAHWLAVQPWRLTRSRRGQGTEVSVLLADGTRLKRISGKTRVMAQDAPGAHFGLGGATFASEVAVTWPNGTSARIQGVPADTTVALVAPAGGIAVESHPAALLGRVASIDHEAIRQRVEEAYAGRPLPLAPRAEVMRRQDAVLAYALASDIAGKIEVSHRDVEAAYLRLEAELSFPPRVWIDQVAVGKFTTFKRRPAPYPEAAQAVLSYLRAGDDVHDAAMRSSIRAWARLYKESDVSEPVFGVVDDSVRGYVESGWLTPAMIWERYGDLTDKLLSADDGDVFGPFELREGRDVQPFRRVWPLLRVFRVGRKRRAHTVELHRVASEIRRMVAETEFATAIETSGAATHLQTDAGDTAFGFVGTFRYDVGSLADRARALGLETREDVAGAMELAEKEAHLNWAILGHLDQLQISEERVSEYIEGRRAVWARPKHARGTVFFFADPQMAKKAHQRLTSGVSLGQLAAEIPPLSDRRARANVVYSDEVELDPARAERLFGSENVNTVFEIRPGGFSDILTVGDEYYIFGVEAQIAAEPLDDEWARFRASRELLRAERHRVVNALLGW